MNNKQAREIAWNFVRQYRPILVGAYLFGSTVEGKLYPRDVDLLLIKKDGARINFRGFPELDKINYIVYRESYAREMLERKVGDWRFYKKVLDTGERLI